VGLARLYPDGHFGAEGPYEYFTARAAELWRWQHDILEFGGRGTGGTDVYMIGAANVLAGLERMVGEVVFPVTLDDDAFDFVVWKAEWNKACGRAQPE
jgi:hypothetical protein